MKVCKYPPCDYYGYHEPRTKDSHPALSILVFMVARRWHGSNITFLGEAMGAQLVLSNISVWSSDTVTVAQSHSQLLCQFDA